MKRFPMRVGLALWSHIEREAERDGVSAAQFVREAAIAEIARRRALRGEPLDQAADEIARAVTEDRNDDEQKLQAVIANIRDVALPEVIQIIRRVEPDTREWIIDAYNLDRGEVERALS